MTRRQSLRSLMGGSLVLPGILSDLMGAPLVPPQVAMAKRVIYIYLSGGFSHMDSFDPKPALIKAAENGEKKKGVSYMRPLWEASRHGDCGMEMTDLFPEIATCADDLCLIRSMKSSHGNHVQATLGIHTGSFSVRRPSIGSWVSYALGTENANLPSFVVLAPHLPYGGDVNWGADFLPKQHEGLRLIPSRYPVPNLRQQSPVSLRGLEHELLQKLNQNHQLMRDGDSRLEARIRSFETAAGMQMEMPEALDLRSETDATHRLYGLERGKQEGFAWQCLVARRLAERGVRFIELIDVGATSNWDAHQKMESHAPLARNVDRPVAGLLKDLKSRGMLEDTLVVFTTEFGRTPTLEGASGRGHHAKAFSSWLAGAGVKPGFVYGKTDEFGHSVVENPVHVHDFHATILHLLGFNHEELTYRHGGRDFRLTDVHGNVVHDLIA